MVIDGVAEVDGWIDDEEGPAMDQENWVFCNPDVYGTFWGEYDTEEKVCTLKVGLNVFDICLLDLFWFVV